MEQNGRYYFSKLSGRPGAVLADGHLSNLNQSQDEAVRSGFFTSPTAVVMSGSCCRRSVSVPGHSNVQFAGAMKFSRVSSYNFIAAPEDGRTPKRFTRFDARSSTFRSFCLVLMPATFAIEFKLKTV
jgi:hypothetical protein